MATTEAPVLRPARREQDTMVAMDRRERTALRAACSILEAQGDVILAGLLQPLYLRWEAAQPIPGVADAGTYRREFPDQLA